MYNIVTDKDYIPQTKNGDCNFLVLQSDNDNNESKYIFILIDNISTIELITFSRIPYIKLNVIGRSDHIEINEDQRDTLFDIINNYMDDSDSDLDSDCDSN